MTALVLLGLAAFGFLALSSASSPLVVEPPPPPPPPPPAPPPKKIPTTPPPQGDYSFFNYSTGEGVAPDSFLNWAPGGQAAPTPAAPAAPAAPTLPRAGEKWEQVWALNRPLSYFELSAAKSAFSSQMAGQTLDSAVQRNTGDHVTVTVTSTFTANATAPIPVGQTLRKLDIVATLASARRVA